jgi:hypothetical protein
MDHYSHRLPAKRAIRAAGLALPLEVSHALTYSRTSLESFYSRGLSMALGYKTGGRQKGTRNRASVAREREIAASGLTPLEFLLSVMRDESNDLAARMDAAGKCAPYIHPKLASVMSINVPASQADEGERQRLVQDIMAKLRRHG